MVLKAAGFGVRGDDGTDDLLLYGLTTAEYLVGSITIEQQSYASHFR